ncbi:hypothetical protein ACFX2J_036417 [Malus domestica]
MFFVKQISLLIFLLRLVRDAQLAWLWDSSCGSCRRGLVEKETINADVTCTLQIMNDERMEDMVSRLEEKMKTREVGRLLLRDPNHNFLLASCFYPNIYDI